MWGYLTRNAVKPAIKTAKNHRNCTVGLDKRKVLL
jgi:hypothetical protein